MIGLTVDLHDVQAGNLPCNERVMLALGGPQRPHELGFNDRTIRPQRPRRFGAIVCILSEPVSGIALVTGPMRPWPEAQKSDPKNGSQLEKTGLLGLVIVIRRSERFIINVETFFKKPEG